MEKDKIVAVVGMCGSGKSVICDMFIDEGYSRVYFGGVTMDELQKRNLPKTEVNERKIREELRASGDMAIYAKMVEPKIREFDNAGRVVLDGLYSWSEYKYLKSVYGDRLVIICVVTNNAIRKQRLKEREIRPLSAEDVDKRDFAEIENLEKGGPIGIADYYIINNTDLDNLKYQFTEILKCL